MKDRTDWSETTFKKKVVQIQKTKQNNENQFTSTTNRNECWGRKISLTSKFSPGSCIVTTLKVSPSGKNRTPHEENGSLLWIFRTATQSPWNIRMRIRKMKMSLSSQRDHYGRCVREQSANKSVIRKPLMLGDSNYWQMSNRQRNKSLLRTQVLQSSSSTLPQFILLIELVCG